MPKGDPPISLQRALYEAWLAENPKTIEGGPIEIEQENGTSNPDMISIPSHHVECDTLPVQYAKNLMIFGHSNMFEGFQVWVTPIGFDYLLMAHHKHHSGMFKDINGKEYKNHPHFHELDLNIEMKKGVPQTRRTVPPSLSTSMSAINFLEEFLRHYYFDDGGSGKLMPPKIDKQTQRKLNDAW